ncbi:MAG: holo-ACP synthase [Tenericutes bacterium]|nr:holo-ACP synthase [Mycoplasmatota bacterium]
MILGIGVDILKISRIKLEHAKRILSDEEFVVFDQFNSESRKLEFLAGRFSVKEAIIKAIGSTSYRLGMRDITIINDLTGMPLVVKPKYEDIKLFISISHELENCVGLCVIETV